MYGCHGFALRCLLFFSFGVAGGVATADWQSQAFFEGDSLARLDTTKYQLITREIDSWISNLLKEWNTPAGLSVAVVKQNDDEEWIIETKGYGRAKEDGTTVDENTMFCIASNSKVCSVLCQQAAIERRFLEYS
jgi:CubicO group peptidase (beta-lactamase class C family)